MLKKCVSSFIALGLLLTGCSTSKGSLKDNLQITKLNDHCYVINNQNIYYGKKLKMNLSQPVDLYLNNKKVISEIGNSDYVVLDSIDGLTVKKRKITQTIRRDNYSSYIGNDGLDWDYKITAKGKPIKKGIICTVAFDKNKKIIEAKQVEFENKEEFTTRLDFTKNNAESHKHTLLMYK